MKRLLEFELQLFGRGDGGGEAFVAWNNPIANVVADGVGPGALLEGGAEVLEEDARSQLGGRVHLTEEVDDAVEDLEVVVGIED